MVAIAAVLRDGTDGDAAVDDDEGVATTPMRCEMLLGLLVYWIPVGASPSGQHTLHEHGRHLSNVIQDKAT